MSDNGWEAKWNNAMEYYDTNYKKLMLIPLIMLLAGFVIIYTFPVERDIDLKGGTRLEIVTVPQKDLLTIEQQLGAAIGVDVRARILSSQGSNKQLVIELGKSFAEDEQPQLIKNVETVLGVTLTDNFNIRSMDPSIGANALAGAQRAVLIAFILMGTIIFLIFKQPMISGAVMLAAFSDIVETYALMGFLGIKLSLHTIAALLMLIGYSVDSDILLTTRVVKRKEGRVVERIFSAIKTGLTMEATTLTAIFAIYFISDAIVLKEIALVMFLGISVDVLNTWIQNAGLLKWELERKEVSK